MLEGFSQVLQTLVEKVSRKAAVVSMAMILIYMLGAAGTSVNVVLCVVTIAILSVFFTIIQAFIDNKNIGREREDTTTKRNRTKTKTNSTESTLPADVVATLGEETEEATSVETITGG